MEEDPRVLSLLGAGEKKLRPGLIDKLLWGPSYYEAADCFTKAGHLLRNAKNWEQAASAYAKAAEAHMMSKSFTEAVTSYADAAACMRKCTPQDAVTYLQRAVAVLTDEGRFSMAAKHYRSIAEVYENDLGDKKQAAENYERAAEIYETESNSSSNSKSCLVKVAHFAAEDGDYPRAKELFEKLASICLETKLGTYGAKEYLLKAGLCTLAEGDVIAAKKALDRYTDMHPGFERDREFSLLSDVTTAVENYDLELFMKNVANYDSVAKLEPFLTTLLLKIKKMLNAQVDQTAANEEEGDMLT